MVASRDSSLCPLLSAPLARPLVLNSLEAIEARGLTAALPCSSTLVDLLSYFIFHNNVDLFVDCSYCVDGHHDV